jgi:hypothetical protein
MIGGNAHPKKQTMALPFLNSADSMSAPQPLPQPQPAARQLPLSQKKTSIYKFFYCHFTSKMINLYIKFF